MAEIIKSGFQPGSFRLRMKALLHIQTEKEKISVCQHRKVK